MDRITRITIGIVGTGYAAKRRAEAWQGDLRSQLSFVAGHSPEKTAEFAASFQLEVLEDWQTLVNHPAIDLVTICTFNANHAAIAAAALGAGKHVVVEYPLALTLAEGESLLSLAQQDDKLLHVEHIELIGGLHQTLKQYLPAIGEVYYGRYSTIAPQRPAPQRWTYHRDDFGFPLMAALSRIHRFTDVFGAAKTAQGSLRYWPASDSPYFASCLCRGSLTWEGGLSVELIYGKGDVFWKSDRTLELHGDRGSLIFEGDKGMLINDQGSQPLPIASRRGLFVQDSQRVLDYLFEGTPLYVTPQGSLYALRVADALERSAQTGELIALE